MMDKDWNKFCFVTNNQSINGSKYITFLYLSIILANSNIIGSNENNFIFKLFID